MNKIRAKLPSEDLDQIYSIAADEGFQIAGGEAKNNESKSLTELSKYSARYLTSNR